MTAVGKILVFLNLVFSLAVGGFAVADYTARTHWVSAFDKLKSDYTVLRTANETYGKELASLSKEKADLYERLQAQQVKWNPAAAADKDAGVSVATAVLAKLDDQRKQIDELRTSNAALNKQVMLEKARNIDLTAAEKKYSKDFERRQSDTALLRGTLKDEMDKNFKIVKEMNQMRDDMVTAQIQARTYKDRNIQLEAQLRETAVQLAQIKTNMGATRTTSGLVRTNPPLENVEGLVRTAKGDLVEISLGTDAGLSRGQTMEVFRLGQNPKYIGRIRIVDVTANTAVGQASGRLAAPIQVGDRVASRIMSGN